MALSARNLSLALGGRPVLDAVSATFVPGRVTAILGANGAGKSTLLRALAALVPAAGVTLDGSDVAGLDPRERARTIGYLPQDAAVHWNMRVRDLVALGRLPHGGGGDAAVDAALAATDTIALAPRTVRSLSGGERARVLLARVLAGEPRWLLADEPLASLDPLHQLQTLALLRAAAGRGMGVVVVLHDLTLAARIADDIVLLKDGRVLGSGTPGQVLTETRIAVGYGIEATLVAHPDGPVIVPRLPI
ncbi:iron complex transport system ATP-binding protein [Sphingomonas guangdongensis]|uniref:Iron complex transport system ATP-binding protein n=1 Tax=Sphingomonas guangdongensis TaxID=1141890 RepID=A0A285QX40_9SPHN|nr:ABC transporter ATP-binding protein [Sphingomonas guangdongensis]SOB86545.1 iron complex transport system ATP-binding protein [Sphingomonas guangdongensis]